jgi:anti-sigma-K factor RskA
MNGTDKPGRGMTGDGSAQNPADLAGAYALHALDADEAADYELYLSLSEQARVEAAELNDTAVALGLAVPPVQPSSGLKASLMAQIASTPQLAPLDSPARPGTPTVTADAPPVVAAVAAPTLSPGTADVTPPTRTGGSAAERAERRWFQRPAGYLAAAAAAAALFVGGTFAGQAIYGNNGDAFPTKQAAELAEINAAGDTQRASTETVDGQDVTLVWSGELGLSAIIVDDLPALGDDQDYQLWYIGEGGPVPAGTFDSTGSGTVFRVLDGTMSAGDAVGVTVEPRGGSDLPTSDPIVAIQS